MCELELCALPNDVADGCASHCDSVMTGCLDECAETVQTATNWVERDDAEEKIEFLVEIEMEEVQTHLSLVAS